MSARGGVEGCPQPAKGGPEKDPLCVLHATAMSYRAVLVGLRRGPTWVEATRGLKRAEETLRGKGCPVPWRDRGC